jgi:hypothetical protein
MRSRTRRPPAGHVPVEVAPSVNRPTVNVTSPPSARRASPCRCVPRKDGKTPTCVVILCHKAAPVSQSGVVVPYHHDDATTLGCQAAATSAGLAAACPARDQRHVVPAVAGRSSILAQREQANFVDNDHRSSRLS